MDLKGAIWEVYDEISEVFVEGTDKKKMRALKKEYKKLDKLLDDVIIKEKHMVYTTEDSNYTEEDFKGKKIMSDERYNELMEEWSKRSGKKLLSFKEENLQQQINDLQEFYSDLPKDELNNKIEKLKESFKRTEQRNKERFAFKKSREEFYATIQKMPKKKRDKFFMEMMSSQETPFEYSGKVVLGEDKE